MNRVLRTGIVTLLICATLLGVAALGSFLYVRYANAQTRIEALQERVAQLESREACRVRAWSETIATSGSNGVLQITSGTQLQKFRIQRPGPWEPGWFSEAWVTECEPRGEILKFDEFSVMPFKEGVIVSARPRINEQISMRFKIVGVIR
jgi:hypothetical protein